MTKKKKKKTGVHVAMKCLSSLRNLFQACVFEKESTVLLLVMATLNSISTDVIRR